MVLLLHAQAPVLEIALKHRRMALAGLFAQARLISIGTALRMVLACLWWWQIVDQQIES